MSSDYHGNIRSLLRFLTRDGENGYAFATSEHEGLIPIVNKELEEQAEKRRKSIAVYWLEKEDDRPIAEQLRQAITEADALIVNGLDEILRNDDILLELNFSREAINALHKPVLFWANKPTLARIGNRAADLFSQRRISTIEFEEVPEIRAAAPELDRRFNEEYKSSEDYENLQTRLNLLKVQLAEAQDAGLARKRIAEDIILPLAKTYSELDLHEEALGLLEEYSDAWDSKDAHQLVERGKMQLNGRQYDLSVSSLEAACDLLEHAKSKNQELLAEAFFHLGRLFEEIGRLDQALEYTKKYNQVFKELSNESPYSQKIKKALAISYRKLGYLFQLSGKLNESLEYFEKQNQIFEELNGINPLSENIRISLAISYGNLGFLFERLGKLNQALKFFRKNVHILEGLIDKNPSSSNLKIKEILLSSYNELGKTYQDQGKLSLALEYFTKCKDISEELSNDNPLAERIKQYRALSYLSTASIYKSLSKLQKALEYYIKSKDIWKELNRINPHSENIKHNLSISFGGLGSVYKNLGKLDLALKCFEEFNETIEELASSNPLSEPLRYSLASSEIWLGRMHEDKGEPDQAIKHFERFNEICQKLYFNNPYSESIGGILAVSYFWLGRLSESQRKLKIALKYFERHNQLLEHLVAMNPQSAILKDNLAKSYMHLGRILSIFGHWIKSIKYCFRALRIEIELGINTEKPLGQFIPYLFGYNFMLMFVIFSIPPLGYLTFEFHYIMDQIAKRIGSFIKKK